MKKLLFITLSLGILISSKAQEEITVTGRDAQMMNLKATCGCVEEGKTQYGMWQGRVYSRIPGEKDKHLFNVLGFSTRQCAVKEDSVKGLGYRRVSREIMLYVDPKTNEVLDTWKNPWTGEEVEVMHVANDPVNRGFKWENDDEGKTKARATYRDYGKTVATSREVPLFYDNPLSSEFQAYVGGGYHAMEIFNNFYDAEEFTNNSIKSLSQTNISWDRVAQWLPWMIMGDKVGTMVFNSTGFSTFDESEIWPRLKKIVNEKYPIYLTPPQIDDARPNETTWTVFKKHMDGKEKVKVRGRGMD